MAARLNKRNENMFLKWILSTIIVCVVTFSCVFAGENPIISSKYVFSYFKGNGEDGLHLAWSDDGLKWNVLNEDHSLLKPEVGGKLMRDPCICKGPDGIFHIVWTSGWWDKGIGIAHSPDLINWSEQQWLGVMTYEPNAMNCWAPEIFYDETQKQYLIFWATTIPGRFPETDDSGDRGKDSLCNHRIYYVTTADFKTYSQTKIFYDDGFNVIDATIAKDSKRYIMFLKDETLKPEPKKNIRMAFAEKATGPYSHATPPFSLDWVEGPTVIKIGDYWYLYYDAYKRHQYEGMRSRDLNGWESITEKLSFPIGSRHGTIFTVPDEIVTELKKLKSVSEKSTQ
jgi:beta-xylosidase